MLQQALRLSKNPLVRQHPIASPGEKLSENRFQRTGFLTEEECGR